MDNFRIAGKAFVVHDGKLLILRRSSRDPQKPDVWEIPGGRLEFEEHPHDGVKREVKEETGIDISILHPMNVRHFTRDDGQTITMIIFLCRPISYDVKISEEHSAYEWSPLESCKEKLTEFFHEEVDIFNEYFKDPSQI